MLKESRAPSYVMVTGEDKRHRSECPPCCILLPHALCAEHGIIRGAVAPGSAVPLGSLPSPLPAGVRGRKGLDSV